MRILYHHRTRSRDGQRVHIDGLIGALRRGGHEVEECGPPLEEAGADSMPPRPLPRWLQPLRELAEVAYNLKELVELRAAARQCRPEAVYSRHALFCFAPALVRRRLRLPWIVEVNAPLAHERSEHGGLFWRRLATCLENRSLNAADRVVVVTRVMGELLVAQGVRPEKIEVHPNGVDPERLLLADAKGPAEDPGSLEGRLVLGFVGYVRDWNRLERTFGCLERHPEVTLVVVGDGPDVPRLRDEARRRGVEGQLHLVGSVAATRVMEWVRRFDVALVPETPIYASPLKVLDYLAAGRAVLAPDRANLREILEQDVNARLFAPDDDEAFDAELEELLGGAELRSRLGAEARATIQRRGLTWDRNAERVLESFTEFVGAGAAEMESKT